MVWLHEKAFKTARRLSNRNEHDLLQEEFAHDESKIFPRDYCEELADQLKDTMKSLPIECVPHKDLVVKTVNIQRQNSKQNDDIAFQGMSAGEALAFKVARKSNRPNNAQLKRRLTKTQDRHPEQRR